MLNRYTIAKASARCPLHPKYRGAEAPGFCFSCQNIHEARAELVADVTGLLTEALE